MPHVKVHVPHLGHAVVLVDREKMRAHPHAARAQFQRGWRLPVPPAFDWSRGEQIVFPIDGNDQYGICYEAAVMHLANCFTGMAGVECTFDLQAAIARYLQLSGGDNGLSDSDIVPEYEGGIIGPNGPRKILDRLVLDINDDAAITIGGYRFCGVVWTTSLPGSWVDSAAPGAVWDVVTDALVGGHAMILTGRRANGNYDVRTWGISPPVQLTPAALKDHRVDGEVWIAFSVDMFDAHGYAPCGMHIADLAPFWVSLGGSQSVLAAIGLFPPRGGVVPPVPPVPPTPPAAIETLTFALPVQAGGRVLFRTPVAIPAGKYGLVPMRSTGADAGEAFVEVRAEAP